MCRTGSFGFVMPGNENEHVVDLSVSVSVEL